MKIKWIVTERFEGKRSLEDVVATMYLSEVKKDTGIALTKEQNLDIINQIEHSQGSLCSMKGEKNGANEN